MSGNREHFGGRAAVIMAMAGSAIGLGNIWRFPYMAGEYGGAAFILIYIACSLVLSLPIFLDHIASISGDLPGVGVILDCMEQLGMLRPSEPGDELKIEFEEGPES